MKDLENPKKEHENADRNTNQNICGDLRKNVNDDIDEGMLEDILKHLDSELEKGAMRMSVIMDEKAQVEKKVSHKCCSSYGRPATETVGLLDMYTDRNAGEPDRQERRV